MTVKELIDSLTNHPQIERHYEDEVVISLKEPSVGPSSCEEVQSKGFGFDWNKGKLFLNPSKPLVRLKEREAMWQMARDFIYDLSTEKTYKGNPTGLAKRALRIIERAKEIKE